MPVRGRHSDGGANDEYFCQTGWMGSMGGGLLSRQSTQDHRLDPAQNVGSDGAARLWTALDGHTRHDGQWSDGLLIIITHYLGIVPA